MPFAIIAKCFVVMFLCAWNHCFIFFSRRNNFANYFSVQTIILKVFVLTYRLSIRISLIIHNTERFGWESCFVLHFPLFDGLSIICINLRTSIPILNSLVQNFYWLCMFFRYSLRYILEGGIFIYSSSKINIKKVNF